MAKKIRFPLKLLEGAEVRTLDGLREHFDLEAVLGYYASGKLLTWLEDRYLEGEAEAIRALDGAAPDFQKKLCEVFQVEYTGSDIDLEEIERRQERLKRLRSITDEAEYVQNIDHVAFDQEELADLLDEGVTKIYLCGDKFTVPASRKGITYVGIKNPTVHISGKLPDTLEELGIELISTYCENAPPNKSIETTCQEIPFEIARFATDPSWNGALSTNHYCLYYENGIWYRYELSSGKKTELSEELQMWMDSAEENKYLSWPPISFGDEIFFRSDHFSYMDSSSFIINLADNTVEEIPNATGARDDVFSSDYLVLRKTDSLKILYRKEPGKESMLSSTTGGTSFNGKKLHEGITHLWGGITLIADKIYFLCYIIGERDDWLACFDLRSEKLQLIAKFPVCTRQNSYKNTFTDKLVGNEKFIYGVSERGICAVDLADGTSKIVVESDKINFLASSQYIAYFWRQYLGSELNLFAVDLATGKIRRMNIHCKEGQKIDAVSLCIIQSTLYCNMCVVQHKYSHSIYKFDLTEETPQPIELTSPE